MRKVWRILFVCHRLPERSFFFRGRQFPICARCTGILLGYVIGIVYAVLFGKIALWIALLLVLPMAVDGGFQLLQKWESTNMRRLFTGMLGGAGIDFIIFAIAALGYGHGKGVAQLLLTG